MSKKYLLLDRDGTLIKHVPYLHRVKEVEILPEVVPVLIRALEMNFRFGIVTNQSVIGRGIASSGDVNRVNEFLCDEFFKLCGISFDFVHYCPHIPEDKCLCRKPNIGMIKIELAIGQISIYESFMIGNPNLSVLSIKTKKCVRQEGKCLGLVKMAFFFFGCLRAPLKNSLKLLP